MLKLLIVDVSREMTNALERLLCDEFELQICHDGITALKLLHQFRPDALILNLILPFKDGLTLLQESDYRPPVILALTNILPEYAHQRAADLGVQYVLFIPTVHTVRLRLLDLIAETKPKEEACVAMALHSLGFRTNLDGYRQLCVGVPIFAANPRMLLSKELYPAIAELFDLPDSRTVEHSIRLAIEKAWAQRKPVIWDKYFPNARKAPSNKAFISRMADML